MTAMRPGGGGGGASTLAALSDIGTMGLPVAQADNLTEVLAALGGASAVRTTVQAAGRTTDAMDGTGWTSLTPASGATTTWAAGVLTLAIPASTTVSGASGVHRADALADPDSYDLLYRVDVVTGDGTAAPDTGNIYSLVGRDVGNCFIVAMNADGSLSIGRSSGGSWAGAYVTPAANTITSGQRTGGQLWFRVSRRPGVVVAASGVGSADAVPTTWTTLYAGTGASYDALDLSYGTFVRLGADTFGAGVAAGWTVDVLAIHTCAQSGAPL